MAAINELAEIFKALSDPTRLHLVRLLTQNQYMCVNALTKQLSVSQSAVSQHLRVLRQAGLVHFERRGYHIHYALNRDTLDVFNRKILETFGDDFLSS